MILIIRNIKILGMLLLGVFIFSCSDVDSGLSKVDGNGNPILSFDMTRSPQSVVDNTQIYVFDNPTWDFYNRMLGVTSNNNILSMSAEAGTWNIALVTANTPIESSIKLPVRGETRTGTMWKTQPAGGELPSVPELRTGYLTGQQVIAGQQNYGNETVMLYRNVALVKVVIDKTRGLDVNGTHKFELNNVPTTINWAGGLYPDKTNPATSSDPMKGTFTIRDKQGEPGVQDSDTLEFIIPAHKGTDFLGAHNDTTTSKLKVSIDLACLGNVRYEKANVEIPNVPRVNGILIIRLSMVGQLEVNAEVLDWEDVALNADLKQTQLFVDKPEVGLAHKDTVYVNTNASTFTVAKDPSATWITAVNKIGNNGVEIVANVDTYVDNSPRTSYITITADNVTKKIPVTQRPDRGTISVDNKHLIMSPPNPTKPLNITSIGGNWKIIGTTQKANPSINQGNAGTTSLSFTRTTTLNDVVFSTIYGDTLVVVKNTTTLDTDTIKLSNLHIYVEDNLIELAQPVVNTDTTTQVSNVSVYGDSRTVVLSQKESWIYPAPATYYDPNTQLFTFKCDMEPNRDERYGTIVLQHVSDPAYKVTVTVLQDIIVEIPEFDYYTVKFTWSGNDVDIQCGFTDNSGTYTFFDGSTATVTVPFDNKYVGYSQGSGTTYNSQALTQWGGDATGGQGETFYFGAPVINAQPYPGQYNVTSSTSGLLPRKVKIVIRATWYTTHRIGSPVTCTVAAYRGGGVSQSGTNFNFSGQYVYGETRTYDVNTNWNTNPRYFEFCTILYDRKKHTAAVTWAP